jgi:hypothetical protein
MRKAGGLLVVAAASLGLAALLSTDFAAARAEADSEYSKQQTYSAALRYLRVDLGYEIVEKDPEAAYLMFRYSPAGRRDTSQGSIEIIEAKQKVKVLVQLPQMPSYHEVVLRDGLMKKLRQEYGAPPKQPSPAPAKPARDAGSD